MQAVSQGTGTVRALFAASGGNGFVFFLFGAIVHCCVARV